MMKLSIRLVVFTLAITGFQHAQGQTDSDSPGKMISRQFYQAIGENSLLYNGTEYTNPDPAIKGDPYFLAPTLVTGDLEYNGVTYRDVPLLYDLAHDVVITRRYNNGVLMVLISEKIKSFAFAGHHFARLTRNDTTHAALTTGFYEVIYDGATQVIVKRHKEVYEANTLEKSFVESSRYFIRNNGKYFAVKNKRELLAALADKAEALKKFMRENDLDCKKRPAETLQKAAAFYDHVEK